MGSPNRALTSPPSSPVVSLNSPMIHLSQHNAQDFHCPTPRPDLVCIYIYVYVYIYRYRVYVCVHIYIIGYYTEYTISRGLGWGGVQHKGELVRL